MRGCRLDALALALLTACASTPPPPPAKSTPDEWEQAAARYELQLLTSSTGDTEPVEVSEDDFPRALRTVLPDALPSGSPKETAQWLLSQELETRLLAEVRSGRVVQLIPQEENSPLVASAVTEMANEYTRWCHEKNAGWDCLGLLADGPTLTREDARVLALAMSLDPVLAQTQRSLKEMVRPQAVLSMLVWTAAMYLMLWVLPEPISKALAAALTVGMVAWLGVDTVWSLMEGWAVLVEDVDRATSFAQVRGASERFGRLVGENTARVLVMLASAVLGGTVSKFAQKLPKLPGFARAAARVRAQGVLLEHVAQVAEVAISEESTFSVLERSTASEGAAVPTEPRPTITTIIRHRLGNRQVFMNGRRWHVPANRSLREIPVEDPMGDQLQAAAQRAAKSWSLDNLSRAERAAIRRAKEQGQYFKAHLQERMARGKFVEKQLRTQFRHLRWSSQGVDAVDPTTGYKYEVLSGTDWNMEMHGRRMADEFFRLIPF